MAKNIIQQGLTAEEGEAILDILYICSIFVTAKPTELVTKSAVINWKKRHDDLARLSKQINHELKNIKNKGGTEC